MYYSGTVEIYHVELPTELADLVCRLPITGLRPSRSIYSQTLGSWGSICHSHNGICGGYERAAHKYIHEAWSASAPR